MRTWNWRQAIKIKAINLIFCLKYYLRTITQYLLMQKNPLCSYGAGQPQRVPSKHTRLPEHGLWGPHVSTKNRTNNY